MYITVILSIFIGLNSAKADSYSCYLCGSSSNGTYKWATSNPNSNSCSKVNKSESECSGSNSSSNSKKCTDYSYSSCPNTDDYGNTCEAADVGGMKLCTIKGNSSDLVGNNVSKCGDYGSVSDCNSSYLGCNWNYSGNYCEASSSSSSDSNGYGLKYVECGNSTDIPAGIPKLTSNIINAVKIFVPILLIIMGMIDFVRAVIAQDEKQMTESRQRFVRRTIAAVVVFLVIVIVQISFRLLDNLDNTGGNVASCMNCFINYKCNKGATNTVTTTKGDNKLICANYTSAGTCPTVDQKGNLCEWNKSTNKCVSKGAAKSCSSFTTKDTCSKDDYGYSCTWDSSISICVRGDKTGKYCADYDYNSCPEETGDDYGYNCVKTYSGGKPVCMSSDRKNVTE